MPKLQAAVPVGAPPNALLCVRLPDGKEVNVRVLEGLQPGDLGVVHGLSDRTTTHRWGGGVV